MVDNFTFAGYALAIQYFKFSHLERWRHLVFHNLDTCLVADHFITLLDRTNAANVEANRRIELECIATRCRFGTAKHHADLHANLVYENNHRVRALDITRQLAKRLRHQAGLQTHMRVAHLTLDLRFRRQRGDRIDDNDADRSRANQHVGDLERLFAGIGLRYQQFVDIDAQFLGIGRIERVFRIDEGRRAAQFLYLSNHLQCQRCLAG